MKKPEETVIIACRCKNCSHSVKSGSVLYCYYWDFEQGMGANTVKLEDFCSNAEL